jgi:hypothetical protein
MLTAPWLSRRLQEAHDTGRVTPASLGELTRARKKGRSFTSEDSVYRATPAVDALDAVWAVAFDDRSNVVGRWRGRIALEVFGA